MAHEPGPQVPPRAGRGPWIPALAAKARKPAGGSEGYSRLTASSAASCIAPSMYPTPVQSPMV